MIDNIFGSLIEQNDRLARTKENQNGVKHLFRRSPLDPVPNQPVLLLLTTGGCHPYDSSRCFFTFDGSDPALSLAQVVELEAVSAEWDELAWGYIRTWSVSLPPQPAGTLLRYHLTAHRSDTGEWIYADNQAVSIDNADDFALWIDNDPIPDWSRNAIVYHVFVDRFYPGDGRSWRKTTNLGDFFGGTLRGVIDKLDYIQSLGFNTIWLSPFFKTTTHHGYNASDYYNVEPRLGTNADLQELIKKAHERDMRMLLDFVANHWSKDHPTFKDASTDPNSPYREWYTWKDWPKEYEHYFTAKELPKINLKPGPARNYMLEVARYWLREGFDGFRLDFAYGPPHDFWVDFRRACRGTKPDCWIFGEIVHTPVVQRSYTGIMDGALDFHLARVLRETFAFERMSLAEFDAFLSGHEAYFPTDFSRPSFLDNHDMSRFLYIAGNNKEKLKLAALILYTLSGPPVVYNGTESGVSQECPMQQGNRYVFEEARLPVKWGADADSDLLTYFRRLGELRRIHPGLGTGTRKLVQLDPAERVYAYLREAANEKIFVAINFSNSSHSVRLPVSLSEKAREHLNGLSITNLQGYASLDLPPLGGAFVC